MHSAELLHVRTGQTLAPRCRVPLACFRGPGYHMFSRVLLARPTEPGSSALFL